MASPSLEASPIVGLVLEVRAGYAPPPRLTVSEFADQHIIVTSGPLAGTHWQTAFAPYQRGIMDVFHEPGVQTAVVMGSSQWGKTSIAINIVAYHMAHDACPILVVEPTVTPMAEDFATNRLDPVIEATPILQDAVSKKRTKGKGNKKLEKAFRGGAVAIGGANSAASLAARAVRLLILDEVDRYPPELAGEGSTISIAMKRTQAYMRRRRILMLSSPTLEDAPIHYWFKRGDQRKFFVPCPDCGRMHPFEWKNVKWTDDDPETARIHCPECDYAMNDAERVSILSRGEWRATNPTRRDRSIVSFHLWEAYSPMSSLASMVTTFLSAREKQKAGDKAEMHTWENTTLGEPVAFDGGEGLDGNAVLGRKEYYGPDVDVPLGACCLTLGIDTQDDRLETVVWGWGPGEQSWLVDRRTFYGDTEQPEPWRLLDELLDRPFRHAGGQNLYIQSSCIDSAGHRTTIVYDYAEKRTARRMHAIIGRDGDRPIISSPSQRRWGKGEREVPLYTIGVDAAKALLMSRLKLTEKGAGYVHLPEASFCDDEFAAQLTSEVLKRKFVKGVPVHVWVKIRTRNEALDCSVYALAALRLLNPNLTAMANALALVSSAPTPPAAPPGGPSSANAGAGRRVARSSYLQR